MNMQRIILILLLIYLSLSVSLPQSGPNDFDVQVAMDVMGIEQGMIIGEAGAGRGFFTFPMAERTGPDGMVYANDINSRALTYIRSTCSSRSITNIITVSGEVTDPLFPTNDLDMVVIVHAFHEFTQPVAWLENLKKYMKSGAVLAILDRDPDRWGGMHYHFFSREKVVSLMKESGYKNITVDTTLKYDNIYLAKKSD